MPLILGDEAPPFKLIGSDGKEKTLAQMKGKKVWLSLYRASPCPLCNLQVSQVKKRYQELADAGVDVVTVFESTPEELASFAGKQTKGCDSLFLAFVALFSFLLGKK